MKVGLLHATPISVAVKAARKCTGSEEKSDSDELCFLGERDKKLLERILKSDSLKDPPHESVIEHIVYTFEIDGISRACLMELERHRIASYSVRSTRYTLKKLKNATDDELALMLYVVNDYQFKRDFEQLKFIRDSLENGSRADEIKYSLPESFLTSLVMTINARSFRNFLALRTSNRALDEIRYLAYCMVGCLSYVDVEIIHENMMHKTYHDYFRYNA